MVTTLERQIFSPVQEYIVGEPIDSPRRLENMGGSDFLLWTLGEGNVRELFGFDEKELAKARNISRDVIFVRTLNDKEIEKKFESSMWRTYDFKREYDRFLAASAHPQLLRNELIEGINNAWTTFTEYAWGKNTKYYYKIVRHPLSGESKLVMYDPNIQQGETWEDAWKREDMRVVSKRFITVKSEKDAKYKNNFGQLKQRDLLEGELMDLLVSQGNGIFSGKDAPTLMSVSPSPSPSKYAREMGYGATLFKKLSHWRIYSFNQMDENTVIVDATTIFTYRTNRRLRNAMIEEASREAMGLNADKVRKLRTLPSHVDILSTPFSVGASPKRTEEIVERVDEALNTDRFLSDYLSVFSYFATRWHRDNRMTDKIAAQEIFSLLVKDFMWQYYCILAEGNLAEHEMLLKEKLILMMEKGAVLYAQKMTDGIEKVRGKTLSKRERAKLEKSFIGAVMERSKGGLCPTTSSEESNLKNSERDGKNGEAGEKGDIVCGKCNKSFTKEQIKVVYHKRSGKENKVCPRCSCDVCGVKHSDDEWTTIKGVFFDSSEEQGYRGIVREKLGGRDEGQLMPYLKILQSSEDFDAEARAARSKIRIVIDSATGELVFLDLFPIRRKLTVLQLREFSKG